MIELGIYKKIEGPEPVTLLALKQMGSSVRLCVVDVLGNPLGSLLDVDSAGVVSLHGGIDERHGFKLDSRGQVVINKGETHD